MLSEDFCVSSYTIFLWLITFSTSIKIVIPNVWLRVGLGHDVTVNSYLCPYLMPSMSVFPSSVPGIRSQGGVSTIETTLKSLT